MSTDTERTVEDPVERTLELLRSRGGRATTPRRLLLQCLFNGAEHRTAEEFAVEVQKIAPDINISTIYRNLDELNQLGIIDHVHLGHGPAVYHLASESHAHLVCSECGATLEVPDEQFRSFQRAMKSSHGFTVDAHHFAMTGRCAGCSSD